MGGVAGGGAGRAERGTGKDTTAAGTAVGARRGGASPSTALYASGRGMPARTSRMAPSRVIAIGVATGISPGGGDARAGIGAAETTADAASAFRVATGSVEASVFSSVIRARRVSGVSLVTRSASGSTVSRSEVRGGDGVAPQRRASVFSSGGAEVSCVPLASGPP